MSELKRYETVLRRWKDGYMEVANVERQEGFWVKFTDAEAALAERDKRIKELEDELTTLRRLHTKMVESFGKLVDDNANNIGRLKELESIIDEMKSCDTCKHWMPTCRASANCSDRSEHWEPR